MVRFGVDIGINTQGNLRHLAHFTRKAVQEEKLLERLDIDGQNLLLDGILQLLILFADTGIDNLFRVKARLDGLLQLVARSAVDTESKLADGGQNTVVVVGLDGIVEVVAVAFRFVNNTFERLAQKGHIVEVEGRFISAELGRNLS